MVTLSACFCRKGCIFAPRVGCARFVPTHVLKLSVRLSPADWTCFFQAATTTLGAKLGFWPQSPSWQELYSCAQRCILEWTAQQGNLPKDPSACPGKRVQYQTSLEPHCPGRKRLTSLGFQNVFWMNKRECSEPIHRSFWLLNPPPRSASLLIIVNVTMPLTDLMGGRAEPRALENVITQTEAVIGSTSPTACCCFEAKGTADFSRSSRCASRREKTREEPITE